MSNHRTRHEDRSDRDRSTTYIRGDFGSTARYRPERRRAPISDDRKDEQLRADICDRLCDRSDLDPRALEVSVIDGEVTLSGSVPDPDMKARAERLCGTVRGVTEVHNELRVSSERN